MYNLSGSREHHPQNIDLLLGIDYIRSMPLCLAALSCSHETDEKLLFIGKLQSRNCSVPHSHYEYFCSVNHQLQITLNDTEIVKKLKIWHDLYKSFKCLSCLKHHKISVWYLYLSCKLYFSVNKEEFLFHKNLT